MKPPRASRRASRGFTLVEMIVTLALMAMIATVLWQAMSQISRVERLLQRSGVDGQLDLVRREWLRSLVQTALVEQIGAPRQFVGDAQQLRLASSETLALPGAATGQIVQLQFIADATTRRQRLLIVDAKAAATIAIEEVRPVELMSWTGREGRFRYLDGAGVWQDQWPIAQSAPASSGDPDLDFRRDLQASLPRLPRAVWIDLGPELGGPLVAEISTTMPGRPRLAQWERQ
ncbi:prepilin-type N-terminal cleavage/methylation domain-containing protein [Pelomonas saccharophila]|uniref:Prepilin-type N-terminal cleavage/methylation domain-containing protein n=1 Tax=Roseateles saccharophilus TaxID=304 RepID=A0ABU1YSP5_ROSSA|nr:prepilin-type N-terminal cleavage/methylation domain-containing protein [Roseateles saccharophilus]MDR7271868.1 prepilin-type N-terminal cleavage/methylation domain-containing protein [Roseateles saccharophilus]